MSDPHGEYSDIPPEKSPPPPYSPPPYSPQQSGYPESSAQQPQQPHPGHAHPGQPYPGKPYPEQGMGAQPGSYPAGHTPVGPDPSLDSDAKNMGMLAHLLGALMGFIGPLIIWMVKKDDHPFIDHQGKEALNFQLTLIIWWVGAAAVLFISCGLVFFAPLIPAAVQLIFGIIAAMAASKGEWYRYPMTIRFIS